MVWTDGCSHSKLVDQERPHRKKNEKDIWAETWVWETLSMITCGETKHKNPEARDYIRVELQYNKLLYVQSLFLCY